MRVVINLNPFTKKTIFTFTINDIVYEREIYYNEIDEWHEIHINDLSFFIHFCYDEDMQISVYPLLDKNKELYSEKYDYSTCIDTKLYFILHEI